jgi:hypothetical protein
MFKCFLGPRSFDSLKGLLAYNQTSFPITFGDIGFILIATIVPIAYLGNQTFIASMIATKFMVNQCPFLLETLARINNNSCFF